MQTTVATRLIPLLILAFVLTPYVQVGSIPVSYGFATVIAAVAVVDIALRPPKIPLRGARGLLFLSLMLFTAWSAAASIAGARGAASLARSVASGPGLTLFYLVLGAWIAIQVPRHRTLAYATAVVASASICASVVGLLAWFLGSEVFLETGGYWSDYLPARVRVGFGSPNFLAGFLVVGIFSTLAWDPGNGMRYRVLRVIAVLAQLACIALTFTRGAWLGLAVGFLFLGMYSREARRAVIVAVTVGAVGIYGLLASTDLVSGAAQRLSIAALSGAVADRAITFSSGMRVIADFPVFGVGPGQFEEVVSGSWRYSATDFGTNVSATNPHNSILYATSTVGIPGGVLLAIVFVSALWIVWVRTRQGLVPPALFALSLGFLAQNMTNNLFFNPQIMFGVVLLAGAICAASEPDDLGRLGVRSSPAMLRHEAHDAQRLLRDA